MHGQAVPASGGTQHIRAPPSTNTSATATTLFAMSSNVGGEMCVAEVPLTVMTVNTATTPASCSTTRCVGLGARAVTTASTATTTPASSSSTPCVGLGAEVVEETGVCPLPESGTPALALGSGELDLDPYCAAYMEALCNAEINPSPVLPNPAFASPSEPDELPCKKSTTSCSEISPN